MPNLFDGDPFDFIVLPDEPLTDGWADKWEEEALEFRFDRFGLALKRGPKGMTIVHSITRNVLELPELEFRAVDLSFSEVCDVLRDLEIAEILKRKMDDKEASSVQN